jgi:two-component system, LytTR family, response regulator
MVKVIIIDDEKRARTTLVKMLELHSLDIEICGEADDITGGLQLIREKEPDVVLLDIDLSEGTGFDLLSELGDIDFKVIFITAHQEYAIKAIKFSALDYLLKPVDPMELVAAIDKVHEDKASQRGQLDAFIYNRQGLSKRIVLKTAETIHLQELRDIVYCEAYKNYTTFHLPGKKKIVVSRTLKEYEEMLESEGFMRVHQSYLINLGQLESFERKNSMVIMRDASRIPVSTRKKEALIKLLGNL